VVLDAPLHSTVIERPDKRPLCSILLSSTEVRSRARAATLAAQAGGGGSGSVAAEVGLALEGLLPQPAITYLVRHGLYTNTSVPVGSPPAVNAGLGTTSALPTKAAGGGMGMSSGPGVMGTASTGGGMMGRQP
jgi:hypothetical protein